MNFDKLIYQHTRLKKVGKGESYNFFKKERLVNRRSFGECLAVYATEEARMENDRLDVKLVSVALTASGESAGAVLNKVKDMGGALAKKVSSIFDVMIEFFTQMGRGMSGLVEKATKTIDELNALGEIPEGVSVKDIKNSYRSKNLVADLKGVYEKVKDVLDKLNTEYAKINMDELNKLIDKLDNMVMGYSDLGKKGKSVANKEDVEALIKEYKEDLSVCKEIGKIVEELKKSTKEAQKKYLAAIKKEETKESAGEVRSALSRFNKLTGKLYGYTLKLIGYEISNSAKIIKAVNGFKKKEK